MKAESPAFAHLDSGGLLIVETREVARALRYAYDRAQRARSRTAWQSPRIRTLDDWLELLWQESRAATRDPRILRPDSQVLRILEPIIERDSPVALLNVDATARAVLGSWRRQHDWHCDGSGPRTTPEELSFTRWTQVLRREQREAGWVDRAQLPSLLLADVPRSIRAERIATLGFDPEPPAICELLAAFARAGASHERLPFESTQAQCWRFAAASAEEELVAAASWARTKLEESSEVQLAVIVPDLAARREQVRSIFDRIVDPASLLPTVPQGLPLYSMIGGARLNEHSIVDTALRALRLADGNVSWTDLGQLLRSPYLPGWHEESTERALLDRKLRDSRRTVWRLQDALPVARDSRCERWVRACTALTGEVGDPRARLNAGAWAQRMGSALRVAGWGEGRPLASTEFQAANRLREVLAELAGLDALFAPLDFSGARRELERLCRDTGFQPESGDPPIRILDRIDHPGPAYDALWIAGLSADRWPRSAGCPCC